MQRVERQDSQRFLAFPAFLERSKDEALRELMEPCSRFRSTLTLEEGIRLFVSGEADQRDLLKNVSTVTAPGVPLNWQALLRFLHFKGLIAHPQFVFSPRRNDVPKTYSVGLGVKRDDERTDGYKRTTDGNASALSVELAMSKAVGETLERYFLTVYKRSDLFQSTYENLVWRGYRAPDLGVFNSFLPEQQIANPRLGWKPQSPLSWVKGETTDGASAYLPAQLVFWNYDTESDMDEPILAQPTTSGAAGHFTKDEAILSGVLENIQRDGFLVYWLNNISPRRINVSAIKDPEIEKIVAPFERYGLQPYFLNTTTDVGVPSVVCAIVDTRTEVPVIAIGGGAGFTLRETILHSACEALSVLDYNVRQEPYLLRESYQPFRDGKIGRLQRLSLWQGKKMLERFSFFIEGAAQEPDEFIGSAPSVSESGQLPYVRKQLEKLGKGYEVYVYEVCNEILRSLGYHVVRTIIPQLIPIYLNENLATLDSKRLREVPQKLGYAAAQTLNPWPHPFP